MFINALSNEQIALTAPSAFALAPYHKQSDRYAFIPTSSVIDGMRKAGFMPVMASQSRTRVADKKDFAKHMIRFRATDQLSQTAIVGDSVLEAVLINSHDGTSAYKLYAGIFRFVCTNGMVVSDSLVGSINVRHTGNVVGEVIEGSHHIFESAPKVLDVVGRWSDIQLRESEQQALAEAAFELRFPLKENGARRHDDEGASLWKTFNRIQEHTTKGVRVRNGRGARPVNGIDGNVNLNRALFTLGQRMEELKAA